MASSSNNFMNRQAFKEAKELEEARKAGTAPPAIDTDGNIINPHIPEYISRAPWYVGDDGPSLKHQQNHNSKKRNFDSIDKWLPRAQFSGPAATKYRKGACTNCGALTHTAKSCLERPRRRGAKITGTAIRPDEVIDSVNLNFEGKRDRWNGYDVSDFERVRERFDRLDEAHKAAKAEKLDSDLRDGKAPANDDSDEDSGALADGAVVQQTGEAAKTAVKNLRIREDTAKYLYNLDLNSAYYDPKSRSMRADPRPDADPDDKDFLGDSFVRHSDDVAKLARMELQNILASEVGRKVPHLVAEPSRAEAVFKEFETKKTALQVTRNATILEKYGGQEHVRPEEAVDGLEQTEAYIEYNNEGKIVSRSKEVIPVGKYPEDIFEKNHTAVWGSYFSEGKWGYACCYQLQRYAFCTGEDGKSATIEAETDMKKRTAEANAKRDSKPLTEQYKEIEAIKEKKPLGTEDKASQEREKRIRIEKEIRRQEAEENAAVRRNSDRSYNRYTGPEDGIKVSEEAMEAYRLRRLLADDPMAKYLADEEKKQ